MWQQRLRKVIADTKSPDDVNANLHLEVVGSPRHGGLLAKDIQIVVWCPSIGEDSGDAALNLIPWLVQALKLGEWSERRS